MEPVPHFLDLGQELIKARRAKGFSLEHVADVTKIQLRYLKAMEEGEWEILPQPYMEAFLKAYAEIVGLNVPRLVKRYRELMKLELTQKETSDEDLAEIPGVGESRTGKSEKQGKKGLWILLISCGMVAAVVVIYLLYRSPEDKLSEQPVRREYEKIVPPPDSQSSAATVAPVKQDSGSISDTTGALKVTPDSLLKPEVALSLGLSLTARATAVCWLRATIDQKKIQDVLLRAGDSLTWEAVDEIHLVIGNAGGLQLTLDGEPLGSLGPTGKPVTLTITPEGIQSQKMGKERAPREALPLDTSEVKKAPRL